MHYFLVRGTARSNYIFPKKLTIFRKRNRLLICLLPSISIIVGAKLQESQTVASPRHSSKMWLTENLEPHNSQSERDALFNKELCVNAGCPSRSLLYMTNSLRQGKTVQNDGPGDKFVSAWSVYPLKLPLIKNFKSFAGIGILATG